MTVKRNLKLDFIQDVSIFGDFAPSKIFSAAHDRFNLLRFSGKVFAHKCLCAMLVLSPPFMRPRRPFT